MTKRILSVLVAVLMVMSLIPMSVFASESAKAPAAPERDTLTYDFEGDAEGWTFIDADGDGFNWEFASVAYAGYIIPAYNGTDCISSQSYDSSAGPLTPDNWAISPAVEAEDLSGVSISFWAQAQDADYAAEHFGLFVGNGNTPDDMVAIQEWDMTASVARDSGNWYHYTANIGDAAVEPGTLYFGIRHFNCTDMFYLNVDLVEITVGEGSVDPTEPPVEPTPVVGYYFESDDELDDFTIISNDDNTYTWERYTSGAYEGSGCMRCHWQPECHDWLIAPAFEVPALNARVTFYARSNSTTYLESFNVYVGSAPEIDAMELIGGEESLPDSYNQYEYDLSAYAGDTIYFAVECTSLDAYYLYLDALEFWGEGGEPVVTPEPTETEPPVEPTEVPPTDEPVEGLIAGYYFEEDPEGEGWSFVDQDGDGFTWIWFMYGVNYNYESAYEGYGLISSASYAGGVLTPDNWAISPAVTIPAGAKDPAALTYYVAAQDPSYPEEHYAVYAGTSADPAEMSVIYPETVLSTDAYEQITVDLSEFAGETIYVAFRHFNCTDMFRMNIDQVEFWGEGGEPVVTPEPTETEPPVEPTDDPGDMSDLDRALNVPGGTIHFENDANYPWFTVEEGDRFYAQSGNAGVASTTSTITTTVEVVAGDIAQFDYKAWGEGSDSYDWDKCKFYVDGNIVFDYGNHDNDWEQFIYIFETAGEHTLTWTYKKDSSVNPTGDYFAVDNVYVGEPVHVEEIIATDALEVPVNRTGVIEWTVLPEEAANKAVTFVSDDPTIATVNENGVVRGVAEGETFVTIASVEDPTIYAVCEITVVDTGLTMAEIYGICTYDMGGVYDNNWVTFTDVDPGTVSSIAAAPEAYAACYAYGTVFGFTTEGVYFTAPFDNLGNVTYGASFSGGTVTSLSYDYTRGTIFGIAADDSGYSYFINVDPASGAVTTVTTNSQHYYGFCIDENGTGYGIANTGDLYAINLDTGAATLVGNTGVSCSYVQDLAYDFNTGDIYWAQLLDQTTNGLYRLDKNTGAADFCGTIGTAGMEIVGMFLIPGSEPGSGDEHPVTGVAINPTEVTIHVGDTAQFTASVQPFNANNKNVEWSVDDESIIMVDQNGLVVGLEVGTAMVCVTTEEGGYQAFAIVNVIPEIGGLVEGFYFEDQAEVDGWTFVDQDGDGHNWIWNLGPDGSTGMTPYEGQGIIYSESYVNDGFGGGVAVNPDNWAISPAIDLPDGSATVTLFAAGQDPSYADEHFAIYAGLTPNPADMIQVSPEFVVTADYMQYEANLADFTGETVYIAIRHFNITDMFILNIDQVEVWGSDEGPQPTHLWGDADGNGVVNALDVLALMRHVMNLIELNDADLDPWCDVNGDGTLDMVDALLIGRYVNEIIPELPCF